MASISRPVRALNRTLRWATGKPQPGFCSVGWPNCFCKAGVSDMEKLVPSMWNVRWPRRKPLEWESAAQGVWKSCCSKDG